ncbi:hypothetical protein CFAM422_012556 [Trichoderma lentiforme]|uniref:Uncharacterized protein n=1 Tax=Trichoderma lentiforme TaxID=1567552 RepID=A0A9P4X288_9HYPO|nr:hypothetical protein CFAM422_012556 [Trichoderma lentiforme]
MSCVYPYSAEPITVPTPLQQRLLRAVIQGGKIEVRPLKRDQYERTVRRLKNFEAIEKTRSKCHSPAITESSKTGIKLSKGRKEASKLVEDRGVPAAKADPK